MAGLVYLKEMRFDDKRSGLRHGYSYGCEVTIILDFIGDRGDIQRFVDFSKQRLITILQNYTMDWHAKNDEPDKIEFIMSIMGKIMQLQNDGKLVEAKALFDLVEVVIPEFQDSPQYHTAEELRNIIWDNLNMKRKKDVSKV